MATLAGIAVTGWMLENDAGDTVEELHEVLANGLLLLIALHVGGVILASVHHHENLTRSMLTGDKRAPDERAISPEAESAFIVQAPCPSGRAFFLTAS